MRGSVRETVALVFITSAAAQTNCRLLLVWRSSMEIVNMSYGDVDRCVLTEAFGVSAPATTSAAIKDELK